MQPGASCCGLTPQQLTEDPESGVCCAFLPLLRIPTMQEVIDGAWRRGRPRAAASLMAPRSEVRQASVTVVPRQHATVGVCGLCESLQVEVSEK